MGDLMLEHKKVFRVLSSQSVGARLDPEIREQDEHFASGKKAAASRWPARLCVVGSIGKKSDAIFVALSAGMQPQWGSENDLTCAFQNNRKITHDAKWKARVRADSKMRALPREKVSCGAILDGLHAHAFRNRLRRPGRQAPGINQRRATLWNTSSTSACLSSSGTWR